MNPQGSQIVNTALIDSLIAKIRAAKNPVDLNSYVEQAVEPLSAKLEIIQTQMEVLTPYLALLSPPTVDPAKIVSWITDLISASVAPQVEAYHSYVQQIAVVSAKLAELQSAAQQAADRFEDVDIDLPNLPRA